MSKKQTAAELKQKAEAMLARAKQAEQKAKFAETGELAEIGRKLKELAESKGKTAEELLNELTGGGGQ